MATKQLAPPVILNDIEETAEVMASAIKSVAEAVRKLDKSRLTRRAIVLLIRDSISPTLGISDINAVLDAAGKLDVKFLKKQTP